MNENFGFLAKHNPLLARLGALAELYAVQDPNTALTKSGLFDRLRAERSKSPARRSRRSSTHTR